MTAGGKRFPVVGVTGLPCSGKSFAAELMAGGKVPGFPAATLFKADDDGHEVLTRPEVVGKLRERFGAEAIQSDGAAAVRRAIAEQVFSNPDELRWLEGLVHPLVVGDAERIIARDICDKPVVVEAALLFAAGMEERCDVVLMVEADISVRWARAAKRGWSREELRRRESRQAPLLIAAREKDAAGKIRVVENNGGIQELTNALGRALI